MCRVYACQARARRCGLHKILCGAGADMRTIPGKALRWRRGGWCGECNHGLCFTNIVFVSELLALGSGAQCIIFIWRSDPNSIAREDWHAQQFFPTFNNRHQDTYQVAFNGFDNSARCEIPRRYEKYPVCHLKVGSWFWPRQNTRKTKSQIYLLKIPFFNNLINIIFLSYFIYLKYYMLFMLFF